jgi:hypothetical protein
VEDGDGAGFRCHSSGVACRLRRVSRKADAAKRHDRHMA